MVPARLWKPVGDGAEKGQPTNDQAVQCRLCSHFCTIAPGERGICGVRENVDGALETLVYDRIAALNLDPVEKKPLFHFLPGTQTLSFATQGCNFRCLFCQNASLSQVCTPSGTPLPIRGESATPEALVQAALRAGARSISYTYSEPTVFFELMQDTARLAHEHGLKNIMVSNGFQSAYCLEELAPLMDAANIDLKAFTDEFYREQCGASLKPILRTLKTIRDMGWWLEVTTLVIPGLNDGEAELADIAGFLHDELADGADVPWHVSRFHPCHQCTDHPPTPVATLEKAWEIGRAAGLRYVYLGNVPGHPGEHTLCPVCGKIAIHRTGFSLGSAPTGICPACGAAMAGHGWSHTEQGSNDA